MNAIAPAIPADDAELVLAYEACQAYLQQHDRGQGALKDWIAPELLQHGGALVAFGVRTDDIVDDASVPFERRAQGFQDWCDLAEGVRRGDAGGGERDWLLCRAFVHTVASFGIAWSSVVRYLDAQARELSFTHFASRVEFDRMMEGICETPYNWLNTLFGGSSPEAKRRSGLIGVANQITDVLVDMRDDLARGRLYLPPEDLERFGVDRHALERAAIDGHTPGAIRDLVGFEVARARALYEAGSGWEMLVDPIAHDAAWLLSAIYRYQLDQIERSGGDVFGTAVRFVSGRSNVDTSARSARAGGGGPRAPHPDRAVGSDELPARARVPRHVGIITDGNRRWARLNGIAIATGHRRGARLLRDITTEFLAQGIPFVSVYLFSTENWNRDPHEINDLMDVFVEFARDNVDFLGTNRIRVRSLGQHRQLPGFLREALDYVERRTADNDRLTLGLCLNYGGQAELVDAMRAIIASGMPADEVSADSVAEFLYAPDIPPLDLIIRTGGQQRLSNFMLWRAAYAELAFVDDMWPAFTAADLQRILNDYSDRVRRFGS